MGNNETGELERAPVAISFLILAVALLFSVYVLISAYLTWKRTTKTKNLPLLSPAEKDAGIETAAIRSRVMAWKGITCTYTTSQGTKTTTLRDAYGELRTGEVTAIMGPSGSGKSTLLDILSGRKAVGDITGAIEMFGETVTDMRRASRLLKNVTAFCPQQVDFLPMQTPEEAVLFVAHLKHGKDFSIQEVHQILTDVGLGDPELFTRPIGGELAGGMTVRGLSGGERKRLALACALAMKPRLMMLDEITSGLDSENALATIQLVKEVCRARDVAAVVVIHQPNGYVFEIFQRLVLISRGECVFSDDVAHLDDLYQTRFACEMPNSMHEVPLDVLRRLKNDAENTNVGPMTAGDVSLEDGLHQELKATRSGNVEVPVIGGFPESSAPRSSSELILAKTDPQPFMFSLATVFHRNLMNDYVRNLSNLVARLICYSACSLLDGAIFWQVGENQSDTVIGAFTFIILISYLLPFATIPVFVHQKNFFLFERSLGLYSPWIFCIAQLLLEMWVVVLAAILEASIVVPMCGLWNPVLSSWGSFFTLLSALIASGLTGSTMVLFWCVVMPSQDLAFLAGAGFVTLSLGLSGGFVPFPAMKDFISWTQWISPCKYSLQALSLGYYRGTPLGDFILENSGLGHPSTMTQNIGVLFGVFTVFAVSTMLVLNKQRERR